METPPSPTQQDLLHAETLAAKLERLHDKEDVIPLDQTVSSLVHEVSKLVQSVYGVPAAEVGVLIPRKEIHQDILHVHDLAEKIVKDDPELEKEMLDWQR